MINDKKSKILIGCLALLLVMAVGYALFSETITINGTATAKGDFDISYTCEASDAIGNPTNLGTCTIEGNQIITTSNLTKPTDMVGYIVTITNNGSIPAVLKTVDSSNNVGEDLETAGDAYYLDKTTMLYAFYQISNAACVPPRGWCGGDLETEDAKITLQPGEELELSIAHMWANSEDFGLATQQAVPETGATMNYNVTLGFEQLQSE